MSLTNQISGVFTMKTFHCNIAAISSLALIRNRMQRARRRSQRTRNQPLESLEQRVLMTATGVSQLMQDSPEDQAGQPVLNNQSGNNQAGKGTGEAVLQTPAEKKAAKKAGKHVSSIDVTAGSKTVVSLSDHVPTIITQRGKELMVYDIKSPVTGGNASVKVERIRGTTNLRVTGLKKGTATIKVKLVLDQTKANQALNPLDRRDWNDTKFFYLKVTVTAEQDSSKLSDSGQVRSPGERVDSRSVEEIASDVDRTLSEETGRKTAIVTSPFDAVREDRQRAVRIVSRVDQPAAENTVTDRFEESGKAFSRPVIQQTGVREAAVLNQVFASLTDGLPVLNNQSGKGTGEAVLQTPAEKKAAKKAGKHIISIDVTAGSSTNVSLSDHVPTIITQRGKESMVYDITGIMTIKGKGISAKVERIKGTTTLVVTGVKQGTAEFKVRLQLNQAIANQALNPLDRRGWSETKIVILKVTVKAKPDSSKLSDSGQVRSPGERVDSRSVEEIASDVDRTLSEETGRKTAIVTSPFDAVREDRQRAVRIVSRVDQPAAENTVTDRFEESGKAFSRPVIQQTGVREAAVLNQVFASLTDGLLD
jgi:ADP-ribose pyrophosphatase YjhB (NUDIX family)